MTRLVKFTRQSPLKWAPLICSNEHLTSLKPLTFRSIRGKEASFNNWAYHNSTKAGILPSKSRHFLSFQLPLSSEASLTKRASYASSKDRIWPSVHGQRTSFASWAFRAFLSQRSKTSFVKCPSRISLKDKSFCTDRATLDDPKPLFRSPRMLSLAQAAVTDYLHFTAGLEFPDAEHMSKNSPSFIDKMLNKVEKDGEEIGRSLSRFLRYHPPNEFELLFESMGLKPSEFSSFLPRDLIFLKDDKKILDNYHVLCNYGIDRGKIGRIYKEATDIFKYDWGVLELKLRAYEDLGLSKTGVIKIVASCPPLLIGDVNREFVRVLEELEDVGIKRDWIGGFLSEKNIYSWGRMPTVLQFCSRLGLTKQEIGTLIRKHPDFMLDGSGKAVLSLIGFLLKVGATRKEIFSLIMQFPQVQVGRFMKNLREGLIFLVDLEMETEDIRMLVCTRTELLGRRTLKKACSVASLLQTSSKRLRTIIKEDPLRLTEYVKGSRLCPLHGTRAIDEEKSRVWKKEFLLKLGFLENSEEMEKALRVFRGKGEELQERYDLLVRYGIDPNDVYDMIKRAPHVLNQKIDVIEGKINFLIKDLGFPLSSLVKFPSYLAYTLPRVKLRVLMYNWLRDRKRAAPNLALSSILASSDEKFRKSLINSHPEGPKMWEKFKTESHQID